MLDLDRNRTAAPPRDAATLILVRDGSGALEVFCVKRSAQSAFMGGAIVFPGGKVDETDRGSEWLSLITEAPPRIDELADSLEVAIAAAIAACREALEEALVLPTTKECNGNELRELSIRIRKNPIELRSWLAERKDRLSLSSMIPFARWLTPTAESRRFDTRFFMLRAHADWNASHDAHETVDSFWATPRSILDRFIRKEIQLLPPTHRTIEWLSAHSKVDDAIAGALQNDLRVICPELIPQQDASGETLALTLPGDPEHTEREARVPGQSRFVLRSEQWLPESAPAHRPSR